MLIEDYAACWPRGTSLSPCWRMEFMLTPVNSRDTNSADTNNSGDTILISPAKAPLRAFVPSREKPCPTDPRWWSKLAHGPPGLPAPHKDPIATLRTRARKAAAMAAFRGRTRARALGNELDNLPRLRRLRHARRMP